MDVEEREGGSELVTQVCVLLSQLRDLPGFGQGGIGFASALLRFQRHLFGGMTLFTPGRQLGGVNPFAPQQSPDFARFGTTIRGDQDAALLAA